MPIPTLQNRHENFADTSYLLTESRQNLPFTRHFHDLTPIVITRSRYPFCSENIHVRLMFQLAARGEFCETIAMEGRMLTFVAAAATAIGLVFYVVS